MKYSLPIDDAERRRMLENGRRSATDPHYDPQPVLLLRVVGASHAWLLAELDPGDPDLAFGLCDPGDGFPTLGTVRLSALAALEGRGLRVVRDRTFTLGGSLAVHAVVAYRAGKIA